MPRMQRWVCLTGISLGTLAVAWFGGAPETALDRASLATAWLCMALFLSALSIGPVHALRTGRPLLNDLGRRDLGIFAALTGLIHLWLGTKESMDLIYIGSFVRNPELSMGESVREALFARGAESGFLVGILILVPLFVSSNLALRKIGPRWWKRLQRIVYWVLGLTLFHGLVFQVLEARHPLVIILLLGLGVGILALQLAGRRAVKAAASGR